MRARGHAGLCSLGLPSFAGVGKGKGFLCISDPWLLIVGLQLIGLVNLGSLFLGLFE